MKKFIAIILIAFSVSIAQQIDSTDKTMTLWFGSVENAAFISGKSIPFGFLADELESYFLQNDSAHKAYKSFKSAKITSVICIPLAAIGLALAFAGTETKKTDKPNATYNPNTGRTEFDNEEQSFNGTGILGLALLGGGALVGLASNYSAKNLLQKAVKKYNESHQGSAKIFFDYEPSKIKTKISFNF